MSNAVEATDCIVPKQYWDFLKLSQDDKKDWQIAMQEEIKSLQGRKVWDLVDLPEGHTPIKGRWVYTICPGNRIKARFIAKGFTQIFGIDYEETFSPVARFETVHLMFALAVLHNWEMEALDVKTAILFGELDEELYMVQPEGFIVQSQESKVCQLWKAIYGLKQAVLQWNKQLHKSLVIPGFKRCIADSGIYVKIIGKDIIIIIIYVDDALFMGSNKTQVLDHKKKFMKKWESRDLGEAKEYLGMRIMRDWKKWSLTLDQSKYANKVIKHFGQENCKETVVPLPTGYTLHAKVGEINASLQSQYQSIIRSLLYIMLRTRPDLAYSVIKMSQYSSNSSEEHLQKTMQIVRYLAYTQTLCITYTTSGNQSGLIAYSDTD